MQDKKYSAGSNIRYLMQQIVQTDKTYVLLMLLMIGFGIALPYMQALLPKIALDGLTLPTSQAYLKRLFMGIGLLFLGRLAYSLAEEQMLVHAAMQRERYMFLGYEKLAHMDYEFFFDEQKVNRMHRGLAPINIGDAGLVQAFGKKATQFVLSLLGIAFFGTLVSQVHPLILLLIVVSGLLQYLYGKKNSCFKEEVKQELAPVDRKWRYINRTAGSFAIAKDVRLYQMDRWFPILDRSLRDIIDAGHKQMRLRDFLGELLAIVLNAIRDGIAYFYLIALFLQGDIAVSDFVFILGLIRSISEWLQGMIGLVNSFQAELKDISYMRWFLDYDDNLLRTGGRPLPTRFDIEADQVSYRYPGAAEDVIRNLSFHIREGERIAIVGVNGAGKSTLIALIMGLLHPTAGEIRIGGVPVEQMNAPERMQLFSVVFQDIIVLPETVQDNVTCGKAEPDRAKLEGSLQKAGLWHTVLDLPQQEKTMLRKSIREQAVDLSGGQNQRLMLARALYRDAPVTILDEPTAALDPIAESQIYEEYGEMTENKTSIFISHRLASTKFCDRIFFMEDGRIVEEGSHQALMHENGKYKAMFDIQAHYYQEKGESVS